MPIDVGEINCFFSESGFARRDLAVQWSGNWELNDVGNSMTFCPLSLQMTQVFFFISSSTAVFTLYILIAYDDIHIKQRNPK